MDEEPNAEANKSFYLLEATKKPLYEGCELSLLSMVSAHNTKCEFNLPNIVVDILFPLMKEICTPDKEMTDTYYSAKKLLATL